MFERCTDCARKVMALATREAQRFNHEYIGTEHILLGIIKEGEGRGAHIIKKYDIDLKKLRLDIEKNLKAGPNIVTIGKLPQTPRARQVVEYAIEYARKLKCPYIGTEHLLYGLIAETEGLAAQILMNNNLDEGKIKKGIEELIGACNNSGSLQESEGLQAQNYWMIPRGNIDVVQFLQLSSHEVIGERNGKDNMLIESKGCLIGRLNPPEYTSGIIIYNAKEGDQLKKALGLRDVFDLNEIEYIEEPSASEVAKELREVTRALKEAVKHQDGLADRLEKRV